jgi:hypothetical protein
MAGVHRVSNVGSIGGISTYHAGVQPVPLPRGPGCLTAQLSGGLENIGDITETLVKVPQVAKCHLQLIPTEYLGHMLIQPFYFMLGRIDDLLLLLVQQL